MTFHYRYRKQIILVSFFIIIVVILSIFSINKYLFSNEKKETTKTLLVKKKEKIKEEKVDVEYLVDIKGEVNAPGIYRLKKDSRVIDVINMAGGLTENANTSVINLSKKIIDEMVIIIYSNQQVEDFSKTKEIENQVSDYCNQIDENSIHNDACIEEKSTVTTIDGKISLNTATMEELMNLPGVGEAKAKSIIEYRESNGNFNSIEDITKVSGIGESLFAQIKEYITT